MLALTVIPQTPGSLAVTEVPDVEAGPGELLVDALALGVCGTDQEIQRGEYGTAPPGHERLVLGHESLGRVRTAPAGSEFKPGDMVVGVVRRPDPVPCEACAHGEFDMCRNNGFTERGIDARDGFGSQVWTVEQDYALALDPALGQVGVLMEPTTIVAKAWEQIDRILARSWAEPRTVLVAGAGPIGLLAALLGTERGLQTHVLDIVTGGVKPRVVAGLGGEFHNGELADVAAKVRPDIIVEATGVAALAMAAMTAVEPAGVVCLAGMSPVGRTEDVDAGALNRAMVLENRVVFGTANANLRHYKAAAEALAAAPADWLAGLITRRVSLKEAPEAFRDGQDQIKTVIEF